jgi:hypothetical protein
VCHLLHRVRKGYDRTVTRETVLLVGDALGNYGFPGGHPLGADRQGAFLAAASAQGLDRRVDVVAPRVATRAEIERFHSADHVSWVQIRSRIGEGYLDYGDTPAFPGCYEVAATVAGTALEGLERIMAGRALRTFQAMGGQPASACSTISAWSSTASASTTAWRASATSTSTCTTGTGSTIPTRPTLT